MHRDIITALPMDSIKSKIKELTDDYGYRVVEISLTDNLHTHPMGCSSFSQTDYNGCLQPDYEEKEDTLGSNMLYYFNGDFVKGVARFKTDGNYSYEELSPIALDGFDPIININTEHFNRIANPVFKLYKQKGNKKWQQSWKNWLKMAKKQR